MQIALILSFASTGFCLDAVRTPHGLRPKACVHGVPSGTIVEGLPDGVRHIFPNGTSRRHGPCMEARTMMNASAKVTAMVAHYPAPLYSRPSASSAVSKFTAKYVVPQAPTDQSDQSIYIWIGTDPDDESDVMQPVLGWNKNGGTDPSGQWYGKGGWGIESWMMVPSGHSQFSDTIWGFQPGDVIDNVIQADPSIGQNGYYISAAGKINGEPVSTVLRAAGAKLEHLPAVQFEVWHECQDEACSQVLCDRMPGSDVVFSDIEVEPSATFYSTQGLTWDLSQRCGWQKSLQQPQGGSATWSLLRNGGGDYPWNLCGHLPDDLASPCKAWSDPQCSADACKAWADAGHCTTSPDYMLKMCMPECCDVGPGSDLQFSV